MKKTTVYIASPGARNKKEAVFQEIIALCPGNDYSGVIYLGPNGSVLSAAGRLFFSYLKKSGKGSAYIPFRAMTIKRLAQDLHEAYGEGEAVSDRVRTLMLCEILKDRSMGYACLLSDLLKKTRHYLPDRDFSRIKDDIEGLIFEEKARHRAVSAMEVLELYEKELGHKNLADPEDVLRNSVELIKKHFGGKPSCGERRASRVVCSVSSDVRRPTSDGLILVIDGFFDPTPLELEIIKALTEEAGKVCVLAEEDTEFLEYFLASSGEKEIKRIKSPGPRKNTRYYTYPSIEEEVEGIAKAVKKRIFEGIRPWEITVSFPVLPRYLPMLRRVFRKYGIPESIGEYDLSASRPFTVPEEMLACIEEDYPRNDFLSILTSPYLPLVPQIVREKAVAYSYSAGIVKGKESWLSISGILLNAPKAETSPGEKEALERFQYELNSLMDIIDVLKKAKDVLSFTDAFESALDKLGYFDFLEADRAGFKKGLSGKIRGRLSELKRFVSIYGSVLYNGNAPALYLRYMLKDLKGRDENRDGVRIVPFELAAGMETVDLFFGGVLEGDFPSRPDIDPILPEKVKKALGLPYLEYYLKRQKRYFSRLLNVSVKDPHFSCPSADGDKVFLPSPYLEWGEAVTPPPLDIYSEEEVLVREGMIQKGILRPTVFWDREVFKGRAGQEVLHKRINAMYRGFFSVTAIDFYRKCPLRFYIENVLGLELETQPKFEVESRLWGSLAHRTMENLFKDGDKAPDVLDKELFRALEKALEHFPIGDFWSRVAREIFRKLLPALKEQESGIRMQGFVPSIVEEYVKTEINGLKLKGKIDRVDVKAEGGSLKAEGHKEKRTVALLDYKTGAVDSKSLQLPLYAGMWQKEFPDDVERLGYYSLKEGKISWYPKRMEMDEFVNSALEQAEGLVSGIKKGMFPPEPAGDAECRYCCHSALCNK